MIKNFRKFLRNHLTLLIILAMGIFLRIYNAKELYMYTHDQDLIGWFVKDVVANRHLRLIGQETSTQGIFIGPLFYYLLIPFYLLANMDPIGGVFLVLILGIFGIWSFYFVFSKIADRNAGLIASLLYSISFYTVFNDREIVPTMPVIIWTVWLLWGIHKLLKGDQKFAYPFLGFLFALTWHLNVALVLLAPLVPITQLLTVKKVYVKNLIFGLISFLFFSLPFILFEVRHNFIQTSSLFSAFSSNQKDIISGYEKVLRTINIFSKNLNNFLIGESFRLNYGWSLIIFVLCFVIVFRKKLMNVKMLTVFILWTLTYLVFFSLYSKRLSEYYLNGLIVVWIGLLSFVLSWILKGKAKAIGVLVLSIFALVNIYRFFAISINRSGYVERKAVVYEIKKDAQEKGFPCVSISYITNPGYDRGYRYFMWTQGLKLKPVSDKVPVYTIVFPLKPIFQTDKDFGAIGLIYPEYGKYNENMVKESCKGEDFNIKDSMIGYTD